MRMQFIKNLLNKNNPIIIEIGANDGSTTREFLRHFPACRLYLFEPDKRCIDKIYKSDLYKYIDNGQIVFSSFAIGKDCDKREWYKSSGNPGGNWIHYGDWDKSGSIMKPKNHIKQHEWCKFDNTETVIVVNLDTVFHGFKEVIDFVWADVQGAEGEMIEGGIDTFKKNVKYLFTEYSNNEMYEGQVNLEKIIKKLECFEIIKQEPDNVLLKNMGL